MKIEEYGIENKKTIVMLHGANFIHTFGRQYLLAEKYHIIVPHIIAFLYLGWAARCLFGVLLLVNGLVFWKRVLPAYQQSFSQQ